jgi:carbonic anhydrase
MKIPISGHSVCMNFCRRSWLKAAWGAFGLASAGFSMQNGRTADSALTKEQRDRLTLDDVVTELKLGNERFRNGKPIPHDYLAQKRSSAAGQYPAAVILGCIDSRAPAEIILDMRIGYTFNARIAGNVVNDDVLGSMEFACAVSGAKVALVLGHTACGAIKGAIDDVEMGSLKGLLARIKPAITATTYAGEKSSKNEAYVDAVAGTNVLHAMSVIRDRSKILADLESKGALKIVGAMYDIRTGVVTFLS